MTRPPTDPAALPQRALPPDTTAFDTAREQFLQGLAHLQAQAFDEAEQRFLASLALLPGRPSTLVNLAATQVRLGKFDAARASAAQALAADPEATDAWFHDACALERLGRPTEALASLDRARALAETSAGVWLLRGTLLQMLMRPQEALAAYDRALTLAPDLTAAWTNRGGLLRELRRPGEAAESFRQAIAHGGDPVLHGYYLAGVGAGASPGRSPAGYVQALFDDYAEGFDTHLVQTLRYDVPARLARMLQAAAPQGVGSVLDLGCGSGLCGPGLRPLAHELVGLDLSPRMLEAARARGSYDRLVQADLIEHLTTTDDRHDAIVAADVFIYLGDLAPVVAGVARVLRPGGLFLLSIERADDPEAAWQLRSTLRYAHGELALAALAQAQGLVPLARDDAPLRLDQGEPLAGLCLAWRRVEAHGTAPS